MSPYVEVDLKSKRSTGRDAAALIVQMYATRLPGSKQAAHREDSVMFVMPPMPVSSR